MADTDVARRAESVCTCSSISESQPPIDEHGEGCRSSLFIHSLGFRYSRGHGARPWQTQAERKREQRRASELLDGSPARAAGPGSEPTGGAVPVLAPATSHPLERPGRWWGGGRDGGKQAERRKERQGKIERRQSESDVRGPGQVIVTCFQTTTVSLVVYYSGDHAVTLRARAAAASGERTRGPEEE